jgi:hypothetical protein
MLGECQNVVSLLMSAKTRSDCEIVGHDDATDCGLAQKAQHVRVRLDEVGGMTIFRRLRTGSKSSACPSTLRRGGWHDDIPQIADWLKKLSMSEYAWTRWVA